MKNLFLAAFSPLPTYFAALVADGQLVTIVASIVLPILFFLIGKGIDVLVQIYLLNRKEDDEDQ